MFHLIVLCVKINTKFRYILYIYLFRYLLEAKIIVLIIQNFRYIFLSPTVTRLADSWRP
jgi:hypothetical protein